MYNKNILVTGGAGGIGTNLIEALVKRNNKVLSWDNYSIGSPDNHVEGALYSPISTVQSLEALTDNFDLVYHLGEYSKVVPSFDQIRQAFTDNMIGSFNLLEAVKKTNTPIVYAGSSTRLAYPGELHSPYAFFKSTVAKLLQGYGDWYGLNYNICYFFNVYGPKTNTWSKEWQSVIDIFTNQRKEEIPLTITGNGTQRRDFTHVDDIVNGLILAGDNISNQEFQLGTGKEYSILEIAAAFDHEFEFIDPRPGDRPNGKADLSLTNSVLGYEPSIDVMDYIKQI